MNSRIKKSIYFSISSCYLPAAANISGGSRTKRKNLNYCEWKRQALCEIWSPVEHWEALGELRAQPAVIESEHRYCNISCTHTNRHTHLQASVYTHPHTQRNKSTAAHTYISAWVIPKAFTTASLTGKKKKKEWERLSEKKKKQCRTHKRLQRAELSLLFQMQPEALDSWLEHFELPSISKHQCSLSTHLRPWGGEKTLHFFSKHNNN